MRRISLLLMLLVLISSSAFSQDAFIVYGKMKVEKGNLEGRVEVYKNGTRSTVKQLDRNGKFDFELDLNAEYLFSFSQDGYVTKKIAVNTTVPDERAEFGFAPFEFQVTLFKQYEGVNTVVFNQPVAKIRFEGDFDDFDYDTDYTKSIQQRLEEVEKEVAEKEKEEEEKAKEKPKKEDPPPVKEPEITTTTSISRGEEPIPAAKPRRPPPPPPPRQKSDNIVVLHSYTVGEMGYPNLNAYGFINFGDGGGRREISKEQFDEYAKQYR